jgi:hypothetical protein
LGIENLEMIISIYNNWPDDVRVGALASMGQFIEMEKALIEKNKDLIEKNGLLEME